MTRRSGSRSRPRRRTAVLLSPAAWAVLVVCAPAFAPAQPYDAIVERDVMVPMRDGVKLATDVYLPAVDGKPADGTFPALLMRTAYNKERWGPQLVRFFAEHGYVSVTQDCRGRYKSEGRFFPWVDDPEDGYDTIEWIAAHPKCNGCVGMHGPSHMAWVQFHAATQAPPHLKAMAPFPKASFGRATARASRGRRRWRPARSTVWSFRWSRRPTGFSPGIGSRST